MFLIRVGPEDNTHGLFERVTGLRILGALKMRGYWAVFESDRGLTREEGDGRVVVQVVDFLDAETVVGCAETVSGQPAFFELLAADPRDTNGGELPDPPG